MVVATPSGVSLAPEGGAHQSIITPLIGLAQPGLTAFEPAFADELSVIMRWSFEHMQKPDGSAVYLRLSTRVVDQPHRAMSAELREQVVCGGYWLRQPAPGAELAICYAGAVAPEALRALEQIQEDVPGAGLLAVTSSDRLYEDWDQRRREPTAEPSHIEHLLQPLAPDAALVTITDSHPASLSWLGSVRPSRVYGLGVTAFGQSGDISALYEKYHLDAKSILDACGDAIVERRRRMVPRTLGYLGPLATAIR
jgi:pyruvate dehydrogenase E1 component